MGRTKTIRLKDLVKIMKVDEISIEIVNRGEHHALLNDKVLNVLKDRVVSKVNVMPCKRAKQVEIFGTLQWRNVESTLVVARLQGRFRESRLYELGF